MIPTEPAAPLHGSLFLGGLTGYDISWPQCGRANPAADSLAVVGVTGGMPDVEATDPARHSHDHNPCLGAQWQWAQRNTLSPMVYVNTANPPINHTAQDAYAYGFSTALNAYTYATQTGVEAAIWWLDVETGNSWAADQDANFASIRGAFDALHLEGVTVGIYCTAYQWHVIAGSYVLPSAPIWLAGPIDRSHALSACTDPAQRFVGGISWLVQYPRPPFDGDVSCGAIMAGR
jgi:hypothetical protein